MTDPARREQGPFYADQLRPGDPYELSNGHPVQCSPTGGDGSGANLLGAAVLRTDPAVKSAGVDTGIRLDAKTLRAPDVAVNYGEPKPGWVTTIPPLAVEYAGAGQEEEPLQTRISDLLGAGTRYLWVVRLVGMKRVEVYEAGKPMRTALPGEELTAPGVLERPVLVEALYDDRAGFRAMLENLLRREGYASLDAVRDEGRNEGERQGLVVALETACELLGIVIDERRRSAVVAADLATLARWVAALRATRAWPE